MSKKDEEQEQINPPLQGEEEKPQDTAGFPVGSFGEHPKTSDHQTLVSALKEAFRRDSDPVVPKLGMDETIPNGKYIVRGQLVNAHGEPIDENGKKLKRD